MYLNHLRWLPVPTNALIPEELAFVSEEMELMERRRQVDAVTNQDGRILDIYGLDPRSPAYVSPLIFTV